jgi:hypothetical protein
MYETLGSMSTARQSEAPRVAWILAAGALTANLLWSHYLSSRNGLGSVAATCLALLVPQVIIGALSAGIWLRRFRSQILLLAVFPFLWALGSALVATPFVALGAEAVGLPFFGATSGLVAGGFFALLCLWRYGGAPGGATSAMSLAALASLIEVGHIALRMRELEARGFLFSILVLSPGVVLGYSYGKMASWGKGQKFTGSGT